MEERNWSGSHAGGVVKNRGLSGCLIIKKKPDVVGGSPGGRKLHESKKEKKRARLLGSDSVSSEEENLELHRRRGISRESQASGSPLVYKRGVGNHGELSNKITDFEDTISPRNKFLTEAGLSRNQKGLHDFDEWDGLSDVEGTGIRHFYGREMVSSESRFLSPRPGVRSGSGLENESGSSKGDIIYKRRNSFSTSSSMSGEKIKGGDCHSVKRRCEANKEVRVLAEKDKLGGSSEAIRLQGKNGVLKVMVKHKENSAVKPQKYVQLEGKIVVPRSQNISSKNIGTCASPSSGRKMQKKSMEVGMTEKDQQRKRKSLSSKGSDESDEESEASDSSLKLQSDSVEGCRSVKRGRGGGSTQMPERSQPIKMKEGKVKRGRGTEKQLLREKIRNMLVSAGWTIDYRPRRGRDYFDAVYVNPTGTAYWSIIKAYDAFQKQLEDEGKSSKPGDDCSSFPSISDDVLSKLTRQTRKKIEKELKRKKREVGGKRKKGVSRRNFEEDESDTDRTGSGKHDDKLSSFMGRSGRSLKGTPKDAYCRDGSSSLNKFQERGGKSSSISHSRSIHGRESNKIGRCTLLIRSSEKGLESDSERFVPYTGKRTLLSWLIDSGTVKLSEKVHYMNRRRTRILEGWITRDGIHCGCCSKILSISKFEIHAASSLRQPFQNIYLSSGVSLLKCQVDAWNRQDESQCSSFHEIDVDGDDPNDDTCAICGDGGNLICCDSCPSTFHQNCLDIQMLPPGDWHCPHCSCKFCGLVDVGMTDARKDVILKCSLCERKYHASCTEEMVDTIVNSNSVVSFCGKKCQECFERLQKLLGVKHELEAGLCWSLIHCTDLDSDTAGRGYPQRVEWNSKLAVALTVMDECFLPIIDRRSGINMIHSILYNCGSNFTRLNYSGFYTAILERGDEIVSAASIRIRGTQFAEMPFIGTRHIYRRQGMCYRLFSAIELALRSFKVEKLIIPAISELMDTWTRVFGFSALGGKDKQEMKTMNLLAFPGTDMLQKTLLYQNSKLSDLAGEDSLEVGHNPLVVPDMTKNCDPPDSSPVPRRPASVPDNNRMNDDPITGFCARGVVPSVEETPLHNTSGDICDAVKLSMHSVSADVSDEVKPLVSDEGNEEPISSSLQLATKINVIEGDLKTFDFTETTAGIHDIGNILNDSPAKHDVEAFVDHKLTQEAREDDLVTGFLPIDISRACTSDALSIDSLANDDHALTCGTLCSKGGFAAEKERHFLSEVSQDDVEVERLGRASTGEGPIQEGMEVEVDGAYKAPSEVADTCSSPQTTELLTTSAYGICRSHNSDHDAVGVEEPQPDFYDGDTKQRNLEGKTYHEQDISGFCSGQLVKSFREISAKNDGAVGLEKPHHDSCDAGDDRQILDGEVHDAHNNNVEGTVPPFNRKCCQVSAQNVATVGVEMPQLDVCTGRSHQTKLEGEINHSHDVGVEVTSFQTDSHFSFRISAHNDEAVGLEKTQLDFHEISNQPILGSDLQHAREVSAEVAELQPPSNFHGTF